ncbi:TetR/AcrR family transcriptional regulator [Maritimibacter sp. DP1N21-5]|uniref:TetR/AcrR family transcriptional regulator n=1 Tax=Maritimibacter sp. DP1N21-5 TaxID=2836867 RepID=UPI001C45F333|nr:TetR/AcrR family transcriptional regulator [Maritimibacter sp. DP1N21-5]MBV7408555.1 TetR/AcrR family transcriptional regulator [Maritimibacter sp. DP1N21-5]
MSNAKQKAQSIAVRDVAKAATGGETAGLRSRKKAKRREEILDHARALFGEQGVDATTMGEIAEAAGVSTPTVFNYFGNKDGILIAIIAEGAQNARDNSKVLEPRTDVTFLATLMTIFTDVSVETMHIASKRTWRYANAAALRQPTTELGRSFKQVDDALLDIITVILSRYSLTLQNGSPGDARVVGHLFYDVWMQTFQDLIRDDDKTIEAHCAELKARLAPLCEMIFSPAFLATPTLAPSTPASRQSEATRPD